MNVTDWVITAAWDGFMDWIYANIILFLNEFLAAMGNMGAEIFAFAWVNAVVVFFVNFGWSLFAIGMVVAVFDTALEYQGGRGSVKDTCFNILKGFMSVSLFAVLPVELYKFSVTLQSSFGQEIVGVFQDSNTTNIADLENSTIEVAALGELIFAVFSIVMIGYAIIKVFFANIKRGGILMIMIAVGSLYMFSVPRGYTDGFVAWCKQVFALCLTAFLQTTVLIAGLITGRESMLLGIGIMLSATEIPRICGQFGLDTSAKFNIMSSVYSAQAAVSLTQNFSKLISR